MNIDASHITIRRGSMQDVPLVRMLNREIFHEDRLINSLDHTYLLILLAEFEAIPVGFKIGYGLGAGIFYSAKGGVLPNWRKKGLAKRMLSVMEDIVASEGYSELRYHTFPTRWPGMLSLGRSEGYDILEAVWNPVYNDYQILMHKKIGAPTDNW
jgi:GNAT superfamily N-acetyltransferase